MDEEEGDNDDDDGGGGVNEKDGPGAVLVDMGRDGGTVKAGMLLFLLLLLFFSPER